MLITIKSSEFRSFFLLLIFDSVSLEAVSHSPYMHTTIQFFLPYYMVFLTSITLLLFNVPWGESVTIGGRVFRWWIEKCVLNIGDMKEIKYLPRTNRLRRWVLLFIVKTPKLREVSKIKGSPYLGWCSRLVYTQCKKHTVLKD